MSKIKFNADNTCSITLDGHQYSVLAVYPETFAIRAESGRQLGIVRLDELMGEYVEVVDTANHAWPTMVQQLHVENWDNGLYSEDCVRWAIAQLIYED